MEGPRHRSSLVVQVSFEGNRYGNEVLAKGYSELLAAKNDFKRFVTSVQAADGRAPQDAGFQEVER